MGKSKRIRSKRDADLIPTPNLEIAPPQATEKRPVWWRSLIFPFLVAFFIFDGGLGFRFLEYGFLRIAGAEATAKVLDVGVSYTVKRIPNPFLRIQFKDHSGKLQESEINIERSIGDNMKDLLLHGNQPIIEIRYLEAQPSLVTKVPFTEWLKVGLFFTACSLLYFTTLAVMNYRRRKHAN